MPDLVVECDGTLIVRPAALTIRTTGVFPAASLPSILTLIVAFHACPAPGETGAPITLTLRSLASAAGPETRAASASRAMSFRMLPPLVEDDYTGRPRQVPQRADCGHRASRRTLRPSSSTSADAALLAYDRSRSVRSGFTRWTRT